MEKVSFQYQKEKPILTEINQTIPEGQCICIIGKNGSGKSTLARLIAGITKPTSGNIQVDGIEISKKENFKEVRKKIGIVFQNPENQILFSKVEDDMRFALKNLGLDKIEERVYEALKQVGMQDFLHHDTDALSLGQKQRITIASVLAVQTKYMVLDEPTTMLDPAGKEEIYRIVTSLKKQGCTIIYLTNVMDEILLSDQILVMEEGRIAHRFDKKDILEHIQEIEESGVKIPTIVNTILKLREKGITIEPKEWTMEELIEEIVKVCGK